MHRATYHFVPFSHNKKLGGIPATYNDALTCPPSCPFIDNACFARFGHVRLIWNKVNAGVWGTSWAAFLDSIRKLPHRQLWRYGVAGDLPGYGNRLNITQLRQLTKANRGRRGYGYTHKPLWRKQEREAVRQAVADGLSINLSANSLSHADTLADLDIAPVVVTVPNFEEMPGYTPAGRKLVPCPEQTAAKLTCVQCQLCAKPRKSIIAFAAHGTEKDAITW